VGAGCCCSMIVPSSSLNTTVAVAVWQSQRAVTVAVPGSVSDTRNVCARPRSSVTPSVFVSQPAVVANRMRRPATGRPAAGSHLAVSRDEWRPSAGIASGSGTRRSPAGGWGGDGSGGCAQLNRPNSDPTHARPPPGEQQAANKGVAAQTSPPQATIHGDHLRMAWMNGIVADAGTRVHGPCRWEAGHRAAIAAGQYVCRRVLTPARNPGSPAARRPRGRTSPTGG